ncbi:alpha-N-acetylglucosaminidase [Streptomyces gamaensis]|uniref:Alpha-N-acetylglucosaminidase n=1 Tax=Streptomyces gamaensis TaxID=1763542 RepID=A0ABW0Z3K1_9ACTN
MRIARRTLLGALAGTAALGAMGSPPAGADPGPTPVGPTPAPGGGPTPVGPAPGPGSAAVPPAAPPHGAAGAAARLLPRHSGQLAFRTVARRDGRDAFRVSGGDGALLVEGTTPAVQLTGLHWYLRHVAHAHFSWAGAQTALPDRLPGVRTPLARTANVPHRFALNDTNDGYTGPYRGWDYWEHEIDVLALHGYNEVLVYTGADTVYHRTFAELGYSEDELNRWIPGPAHQPWWLVANLSSVGGPVWRELLARRADLARRIVARLRELGMTPVLPGYFGTVPPGFAERHRGARTVPQGDWGGFRRPDWLDPRTDAFARVAETFYRVQEELYGPSTMYKMDLLHEGGTPGDVPVGEAARAVERALRTARPDAVWAVLGWQNNPRRELLAAVDRSRMLVLDGLSDRYAKITDREADFNGTPYAFGTIFNFGGHTAIGANTRDWAELYHRWRTKPRSALRGIALMPEAADNNPAAMALFSDLPWTDGPPQLRTWFAQWPLQRYGTDDAHAAAAWDVLRRTAYGTSRSDGWSEPADSLFGARPDLATTRAAAWSPLRVRYDTQEFEKALTELLAAAPALHGRPAYRYDLLDVTRQAVANRARLLLPRIKAAHDARDRPRFRALTRQWFAWTDLLEAAVATDERHLLGRWIADARAWGTTDAERARLAQDALSLLTVWGPKPSADGGRLHDYANREWSGLVGGLYRLRWQTYFSALETSLATGRRPKAIDWYALEDRWLHTLPSLAIRPKGDIVAIARTVAGKLRQRT